LRLEVVEHHDTKGSANQAANQQHGPHPEVHRLSFEMRKHARKGGRNNLVRLSSDRNSRRDAYKEQQWRHQKSATNPEHARQNAHNSAQT